ncbi:hypothetical protein YC2023_055649 [Brassica napus]
MELHKAPVLQILSIRLGPHCPTDADVGEWVENAVNRGVRELFFTLQWSADPTRLPKSLNTCKTLLHLRLSHKILVDFPTSSCLPSLERLQLYYVVYKDEASLVALLSSCPVLELLYVMRNEDDNVAKFSVKVPCLRVLLYFNAMSPDENDVVDPGDSWSIKSMHCLQDVFIIGQSFHDMSKLLRSASAVSYLGLHLTDELAVYCSTIEFPQLIQCTISPCNSNWMDSLILFLGNTPKLKELTVDYSLTYEPPVASASWMLRFPDPECLSSSLKKFELKDYETFVSPYGVHISKEGEAFSATSSTPSKHGGVQKIELATIVEFIVCVVNSPPQVCGTIEFHCTGQVDDSEKTDGPMLHHQSFAYKEVVTTLEMIFWML